MWDSYILQYIL